MMAMACMLINVDAVKLYAPRKAVFASEECSGGLFPTLLLQGEAFRLRLSSLMTLVGALGLRIEGSA